MGLDGITLNGKPLKQVLRPQTQRSGSGARSSKCTSVDFYIRKSDDDDVLIAGILFPFEAKEPFVRSGHGPFGAFASNRLTGKIKCHECGTWWNDLGVHVVRTHEIPVRQYQIRHGLRSATGLASHRHRSLKSQQARTRSAKPPIRSLSHEEAQAVGRGAAVAARVRANMGKGWSVSPEQANLKGKCQAQIVATIKKIAGELRRTPTTKELNDYGIWHHGIRHLFDMPLRDVLSTCGLRPNYGGPDVPTRLAMAERRRERWNTQSPEARAEQIKKLIDGRQAQRRRRRLMAMGTPSPAEPGK